MMTVTEEECALVARIGVRSGKISRHLQSGKVRRIVEFFGDGETREGKSVCVYVCVCLWEGGSSSEEGDGVQRHLIKVS
jgi:hypothetical protein